jgi:hypothetical protein
MSQSETRIQPTLLAVGPEWIVCTLLELSAAEQFYFAYTPLGTRMKLNTH